MIQRSPFRFPDGSLKPIRGAHGTPSIQQTSFRFRDDDNDEVNATNLGAGVNSNITVGDEAGTDKGFDTNIRIRFLLTDTGGGAKNNFQPQLEYNHNGAGWGNNVNGASSPVVSSSTANYTDDDDSTQQIGSGTFITPNSGMDDDNGLAGEQNDIDFADSTNDEVEVEYCFQVIGSAVSDTDTIDLRVQNADSWSNTPRITIDKVALSNVLPGWHGSGRGGWW